MLLLAPLMEIYSLLEEAVEEVSTQVVVEVEVEVITKLQMQ
jgi:hypothetical protein